MQKQKLWLCFNDEVHGINAGWRVAEVEEGRKWVFVKVAGKQRKRVHKKTYENMGKRRLMTTEEVQAEREKQKS